jgi:SAM-dependent methyltransferase
MRRWVSPVAIFDRRLIAYRFLRGEGIEIGALHLPLKVPRSASVKYVDCMTAAELRKQYPELADVRLVDPDIIDDGNRLERLADGSQNFVIANHLIEHSPDPLGAIANMLRVLREDGRLFLAIPDKRFSFDVDRPITTLEHLIRDHEEGPEWSRRQHYEEWVRFVDKKLGADAEKRVRELMHMDYSIHFHVWTSIEMMQVMTFLKKEMHLQFDIEFFYQHLDEGIFILKKSG